MKTIYGNGTYSRVKDDVAEVKVKTGNFRYAPKSEWKKNVRDVKQTIVSEVVIEKSPKPAKNAKTNVQKQRKGHR